MLKHVFAALIAVALFAGVSSACGYNNAVAVANYGVTATYQATYNPTVTVAVANPVYNQVKTVTVVQKQVLVPTVVTHQQVTQQVTTKVIKVQNVNVNGGYGY